MRTTRLLGLVGGCLLISGSGHAQKAAEGTDRLMPIEDIFSIQDREEASSTLTDAFASGHLAIPGFGTFIPGFGTFIPGFGTFGTSRGSIGSVTFSNGYSTDKDILEAGTVALLGRDTCGDVLIEVESVCGGGQSEEVPCIVRIPDDAPIGRFTPVMVMPGDSPMLTADQGSLVVIFEGIGASPGPQNGIGTTPIAASLLEDEGIFYAKHPGSEPRGSSIFDAQPGKGLLDALDYASLDVRESPAATVAYLASWFSASEAASVQDDEASAGTQLWSAWDDASGHFDVAGKIAAKSAKYGQCWVFAGLMSSMTKALGIPTRSVTNIDSAHESNSPSFDQQITKKVQYNESDWDFINRSKTTQQSADSIWNFHVWSEVNVHTAEWTDHNIHDPGITILEMLVYGKPGIGTTPNTTAASASGYSQWNFHVWTEATMQTDTGEVLFSEHGGEPGNFHVWVETFFESPAAPDGGWHAIELTGISYPTLLRANSEPTKMTGISYPTLLRSEVEAVDAKVATTTSKEPVKKTKISMPTLLKTGISYPTLLRYSGISMPTLDNISMPTLAISMPTLCE